MLFIFAGSENDKSFMTDGLKYLDENSIQYEVISASEN